MLFAFLAMSVEFLLPLLIFNDKLSFDLQTFTKHAGLSKKTTDVSLSPFFYKMSLTKYLQETTELQQLYKVKFITTYTLSLILTATLRFAMIIELDQTLLTLIQQI